MVLKLRHIDIVIFLAGLMILSASTGAFACACCSELGERSEGVDRFASDNPDRNIFSSLRFEAEVKVYDNEAGHEITAPGIVPENYGPYELVPPQLLGGTLPKEYDFVFTDKQTGKKGRIVVPIPAEYEYFAVDPRSERIDPGIGPAIYRELRINSKAKLSGIFAHGGNEANARFVVQGFGGGCGDLLSYNAFTLIIEGEKTGFTLLGWLNN